MTGQNGGQMGDRCDVCIRVPAAGAQYVQELHLPVYHTLCRRLEARFFPCGAAALPRSVAPCR